MGADHNKGYLNRIRSTLVTEKSYRSFGIVLVLGGVLYLCMVTRIRSTSVQESLVFQPVPSKARHRAVQAVPKRINSPTEKSVDTTEQAKLIADKINSSHKDQPNNSNTKSGDGAIGNKYVPPGGIENTAYKHRIEPLSTKLEVKVTEEKESDSIPESTVKEHVEIEDNNATILSNKKIVIIVAYMRTGSTLTASVLQQYPGTFYVFEPIRALHESFKKSEKTSPTYATFNYIDGKQRKYKGSEQDRVVLEEVNSWLTCRLGAISLDSLMDDFHFHFTQIMKRFYACAGGRLVPKTKGKKRSIQLDLQRYNRPNNTETCLKTAITYCQKAPLLLLKFIRIQMKEVVKLLPLYPNMKVIHLVRDPRGIFNSRLKTRLLARKNLPQRLNNHCTSVENKLKYSKIILEKYANRLKIVHYEDMAEDPVGTARDLADFAGIEFLSHMKEYISKQTNSTSNSGDYGTQRKNSNSTANKWRNQLDPKVANDIYEACKSSNTILGYLPLNNGSMRNLNIPSRKIVHVEKELFNEKTT